MKTPHVAKFKRVLFCNTHREECRTVNKAKKNCTNICGQCNCSEEIYQNRNT